MNSENLSLNKKSILQRMLSIGVDMDQDEGFNNRLRIINIFTWICVFFCLPYWIIMFVFGEYYVALLFILIQAIFSTSLLLAHYKYYVLSKVLILLTTNYIIFCLHLFYGSDSGFYIYYYCGPIIVFTFFPFKEKIFTIIFHALYLLSYAILEILDINGFKGLFAIDPLITTIFYYTNLTLSFFFSGLLALSFSKFHFSDNEEIRAKNRELERNKMEMESLLKDKATLLSETHHRVKNNLAVISGMFDLQMMYDDNKKVRKILTTSKNRIKSISLIHESLYKESNVSQIEFKTYIQELVREIQNSMESNMKIDISVEVENIFFDLSRAIPCGLIINEVITNSFKHAFAETEQPKIKIRLTNGANYKLEISDNGVGFDSEKEKNGNSLGHTLIHSLSKQLDGNYSFESKNGLTFKLTFA